MGGGVHPDRSMMGWSTVGVSLAKLSTQVHWAVTWPQEGMPREPVCVNAPDFSTMGWVQQRAHAGGAAGQGSGVRGQGWTGEQPRFWETQSARALKRREKLQASPRGSHVGVPDGKVAQEVELAW